MRIYNKYSLVVGIVCILSGGFGMIVTTLRWAGMESLGPMLSALNGFLFGIACLLASICKMLNLQGAVEAQDERNQLLVLKTQAKITDLMGYLLVILFVIGIAGYFLTSSNVWLIVSFLAVLPITLYQIAYAIIISYYEHHL